MQRPHDATLLDILIDGFEKNEIFDGFHDRVLPMPDLASAVGKFGDLLAELARWKGPPADLFDDGSHRIATWPDVELVHVDRGIMIRVRAPWFSEWWHDRETWSDGPLDPVYDWLATRRANEPRP